MQSIFSKGANSAVIDIGYDHTGLTFFKGGNLQFAREIPVGGNHFTAALMQTIFVDNTSYVLSWDEAEVIKKEIGLPAESLSGKTPQGIPYSEIAVMMRPVAEKLASEIRMSIDYYKENFKVDSFENMYVAGNAIRLKRLKNLLESSLGRALEPVNVLQAVGTSLALYHERTFPMDLIGAALSGSADLNFLPPSAKKEFFFRRAFSKVVSILIILLAVMAGSLLYMGKQRGDLEQILDGMNASRAIANRDIKKYDQLLNETLALNTSASKLKEEIRIDSTTVKILQWISQILPEEIVIEQLSWGRAYNETELRRETTKQTMKANNTIAATLDSLKTLNIVGVVYKDDFYADVHLLNFITALEQNPFFHEVRLIEKRREVQGASLRFELSVYKK
jgi:AraC-like DNA-binding protein